jgi:hypothetical protein
MPKKETHQSAGEVFKFEVSEQKGGGFKILVDGKKMLLPRGDVFDTPSRAYADFTLKILSEGGVEHFKRNKCLLCHECTLFIDFSSGVVSPESEDLQKFRANFAWCSTYDPIHALCAGPEIVEQLNRLRPFHEFCADRGIKPPNWGQTPEFGDSSKKSVEDVLRAKRGKVEADALNYFRCIEREFQALSAAQQAVVYTYFTFCSSVVGSPSILPLLLVKSLITPQEFAEGFLATLCVIPGVFGDVSQAEYKRELKKVRRDAERALFFLKCH